MLMLNLSTILIDFDLCMCGWNSFWKHFLPVLVPICSGRKRSWSNQWSELNSGLCRNWEMLVLQVWQTHWSWRRVKLQTFWNHQATPLTSTGVCFLTWIFPQALLGIGAVFSHVGFMLSSSFSYCCLALHSMFLASLLCWVVCILLWAFCEQ